MRKLYLLGILGLSGCATHSNDIAATYVSPLQYDAYSCPQLREEAARISAKAAEAAGVQDNKANGDAVATGVALVLFWPAAFFVKGNGATGAEVAHL